MFFSFKERLVVVDWLYSHHIILLYFSIILEELVDKLIEVHNLTGMMSLVAFVHLFEKFVHRLWIEFEITLDFLHPCLVELIETALNKFPDFEVNERVLFVKVNFDNIGNEKKGELHFSCIVILFKERSDVCDFFTVIV